MAEFVESIKGAVKVTCSKAKKVAGVALLKVSLRSKEVDMDECLEKLGRAYFMRTKRGISNEEKINLLLEQAEQLCKDIDDLKQQIANAQSTQVCTHCASIYKQDAEYCPYCSEHKVVATPKSTDNKPSETEE